LIYISYGMDVIMLHDVSLITTLSYNSRDQISCLLDFLFLYILQVILFYYYYKYYLLPPVTRLLTGIQAELRHYGYCYQVMTIKLIIM
jgi:hypothetical protein